MDSNNSNNNNGNARMSNNDDDIIHLAGLTFGPETHYAHVMLLQLFMNQSFRHFLLEELVLRVQPEDNEKNAVLELQNLFRRLQLHEYFTTLTETDLEEFHPAIRTCFPIIRSMVVKEELHYDPTKFLEAYDKASWEDVYNPIAAFKSICFFSHLFQLILRVATKYGGSDAGSHLKDNLHADAGGYRICKICRKDKVVYMKTTDPYPYYTVPYSKDVTNLEEALLRQATETDRRDVKVYCSGDCQRKHRHWLSKTNLEKLPELLVWNVDRHYTKPNGVLERVDTPFTLPESLDVSPFLDENTLREYQNKHVSLNYQWMGAVVQKETRGIHAEPELCYIRERNISNGNAGWIQVQGSHYVRVDFSRVQEVCFAPGPWEVIAFYERRCSSPTTNETEDRDAANTSGPTIAAAGACST